MLRRILWVLTIAALSVLVVTSMGCGDNVSIGNSAGNEHGLLVDGQDSAGPVNDRGFVSASTTIGVGSLEGGTGEVFAFTQNRPVARQEANWTTGNDSVPVNFSNKINVPVTVWIVKGDFNTQRTKAINACIYTTARFDAERVGVGFSSFEIIDKTGMANASTYYHFPSGSDPQDWKDNVGWKSDRVNIYYLETVSGSTTTGRAVNFTNFIVLGESFGDIAVVHEVGHSYSARHKSAPDFNDKVIMWPFYDIADPWEFLSEGELFRMHVNSTSALNNVYNARPGQIQRSCVGNVTSAQCVDWKRRLWADGVLPAN